MADHRQMPDSRLPSYSDTGRDGLEELGEECFLGLLEMGIAAMCVDIMLRIGR
jgi:hypothetical protein